MNIEVGEYIRTKQGDISKVRYVDEENIFLEDSVWSKNDLYEKTDVLYFDDEEIAKHSKNIIDLIEVNDIVTYWVDTQSYNGWVQNFVDKELLKDMKEKFINEDIKSIVTHEQIENMEYRV